MYVGRTNWAYYNEFEDYPAEWIENLIRLGVIAPGVVDRRSIEDVRPDDLRGFRQCHFFAGIGVWSYALRRAGVSDDAALWTGSCPCQPFSAAGKGDGVDDERHLWPHWFHLIEAVRPPRIYGEQVASKDGLGWLDLVQADLEGSDYSIWAVDTCSAGSGAPHIRQRLRFCADDLRSSSSGIQHSQGDGRKQRWSESSGRGFTSGCGIEQLAYGDISGLEGRNQFGSGRAVERASGESGVVVGMADNERNGRDRGGNRGAPRRYELTDGSSSIIDVANPIDRHLSQSLWRAEERDGSATTYARTAPNRPSPTNGFWGDSDWLFCRDGKWRPVGPGTFPLVDGSAFNLGSGSAFEGKSRQGMLKGYGNAIDAETTIDFIEATLEPDTIELNSLVVDTLDDLLG